MNCKQIHDLLDALPLAEFTPEQLSTVEMHANACTECRALLNIEKELNSLLKEMPEPQAPAEMSAAVMSRIQQHGKPVNVESRGSEPIQTSEWPISMIAVGIAITFCLYTNELLSGRSTTFNLFSLWTNGWEQWLFESVQLNLVGLLIAASVAFYLFGFFSMFRDRKFSV